LGQSSSILKSLGEMASPKVWGPALWSILHIYTEKLGNQTNEILSTDQRRAWINFLKSVEGAIPCARCRAHYKEWRIRHPIEAFSGYQGLFLKQKAREWLWGLHDSVNKENNIVGPPIESLAEMYGAFDPERIRKSIEICSTDFKKAMLQNLLSPDAYRIFMNCFARLKVLC
jgi:hypothetical protein